MPPYWLGNMSTRGCNGVGFFSKKNPEKGLRVAAKTKREGGRRTKGLIKGPMAGGGIGGKRENSTVVREM